MKTILAYLFILVIFFLGFMLGEKRQALKVSHDMEVLEAYEWYSIATEELLDTLEAHYNWVDAIDNEEYYYWNYKLDSLYNE